MIKGTITFGWKHPIFIILSVAFLARVVFAIFLNGNGSAYHNFIYFETPYSWLNDTERQCSEAFSYNEPQGISLVFLSINYAFLSVLKFFGISNFQWISLITHIFHIFISLLVISFSYRIAELLSSKKTAIIVATLLMLCWLVPYINVFNSTSMFGCMFLLYATLIILRQEINKRENKTQNVHRSSFIVAGFSLGLGFSVWYFNAIYAIGIFLILIINRDFRNAIMTLIGFIIAFCIFQTIPDMLVWNRPFAELQAFVVSIF